MHAKTEKLARHYASAQCPHCGTAFRVDADQKEGICFNCGRRMDLQTAMRDAGAFTYGYETYAAMIADARRALDASDFKGALRIYERAAKIAPDDYSACFGVLMSSTEYMTDFNGPLRTALYSNTRLAADPAQKISLDDAWNKYAAQYKSHKEAEEQAAREKQEKKKRAEEQRVHYEKERQSAWQGRPFGGRDASRAHRRGAAADEGERDGKRERRLHPVLRYLLIGAGAVLAVFGLASCAAMGMGGGGLFFFLASFGFLGSGNRNRRR